EHTSELQSLTNLVCRLLLEKKTCALRSEEHTSELQSLTNIVCPLLPEKKPQASSVHYMSNNDPRKLRGSVSGGLVKEGFLLEVHTCRLFFFNDTATTEIYTLSLHDALPI